MKLQILIPTLPERKESFESLVAVLKNQTIASGYEWGKDVHYLSDDTARGLKTIGEKRNELLQTATADYVAYCDDDDSVNATYILRTMEGIEKGVDCCSLRGVITTNGERPEVFEHSIRYDSWYSVSTGDVIHFRPPNHLNCIKRSIAQQLRFPDIDFGEDHIWSEGLQKMGLIKSEYFIDEIIYNYDFIPNK